MKVRKEQFDEIQHSVETSFVHRVSGLIRKQYPDHSAKWTDAQLDTEVRWWIAKGRTYGLTFESTLGRFTAIGIQVSPRFDEEPGIACILHDWTIPELRKMDLLENSVMDWEWES